MLTQRQIAIFKAIVDEFTRTAEPVGSKTLMNLLDFQCSSATIRNEMAVLEDVGLLEKTHTSSGRIPSRKGYRFYVEHLMEKELDSNVKYSLQQVFSERHYSMDEIVKKSCDILSQMTHLTSVVLGPESKYQTLQHIQLVPISSRSAVAIFITDHGHTENKTFHFETDVSLKDLKTCTDLLNDKLSGTPIKDVVEKMKELEPLLAAQVTRHEVLFEAFVSAFMKFASDKVYCSGQSNMLYQPEFADINKLREVMKVLEDSSLFRQLANHEGNVAIEIGGDNELIQVDDMAVVSSKFHLSKDEEGQLMIIGPTRMQYNRVVALMEYMSKVIEDLYKKEE
ncbi:heat-inducible transcriptional repressor HrcA [Merdibacter massiliensis]|uniref:heat-inducible transcriptional repressor HrcA n=1 Tax=Merdibacter massiliensis TaxID=1871030 RepID=UPI00096A8CA6|nr:heat-inducible transcriptional repressor HrcA [Merdibacter massiliensis]